MCGIAGCTGRRDEKALQAMLDAIAHRGPDDEGQEWIEAGAGGWVGLGNRRLAILDLSPAGHQPMAAEGSVLAYNGEIFNFGELRRELEASGIRFQSGADTEVVLHLLRRDGVAGLSRLNGMFGLAFWDADRRELLVARDRFGIKPLYYRHVDGELSFASEAKCLFAAGARPEMNLGALGAYLSFGWVPGPATMYRDVVELQPGWLLRWRQGDVTVEPFHATVPRPEPDMDAAGAAATLRDRLRDSVRRQMIADVPVGVLLSGGLDSSAIAAFAAESSSQPVRAYTIAFRPEDAKLEQNSADARSARLVAQHFGLELQEFVVSPDVTALLHDVAHHIDDPVADPAAMLTLIISRAASKEVKVLLSGQGADELFGGYRVHLYDRIARQLARQPQLVQKGLARGVDALPGVAERLPGRSRGLLLATHRATSNIADHLPLAARERYIAFRSAYYFQNGALSDLLAPAAREVVLAQSPSAFHLGVFAEQPDLPFFDQMLYVDFKTFLCNQNLAYSDRMSMAASIEMRVPFLDDEVADLALRIPESLKVRRLRGKQVLRRSMRGVLPDEIIDRRKAAFAAPIRAWLRGELRPLLDDVLSDRWLDDVGTFDRARVRALIDEHASGQVDHSYRIWTLLTLAMWHQAHIAP
jgi:asparagine synthase (glutamine-hydrolysing)